MFHVIFLGFSTKMIFCFFARANPMVLPKHPRRMIFRSKKNKQKHTLPPRCFSAKSLPTSFGAVQFHSCLEDGYGNLRVPPKCRRNKAFPGVALEGYTLKLLWWLQILGIGEISLWMEVLDGEGVPLLIALLFNELRNDTHKNQHLNWPPFKRKTCGDITCHQHVIRHDTHRNQPLACTATRQLLGISVEQCKCSTPPAIRRWRGPCVWWNVSSSNDQHSIHLGKSNINIQYVYLAPKPELRTFRAIPLNHNLGWPRLRSLYNLPKCMLIHLSKNIYLDTQFRKRYNRL